ncbi:polyprenyl synthetase family protein [Alkalicoccus urumqiensis]|uniref:Heptaprenyl diphosphate synthase n=1 Tax=Alkalicoccus urumqiensis TaxID=1548213 RepID=A0A2P6MKJ1_ALKUR|nr:polyprenyl synthetase family protein [Alkalicoccus urumqiensis]PRO66810.1 heptaprenyl diphosphate synthase [Alkalicoccus urumqiensis]
MTLAEIYRKYRPEILRLERRMEQQLLAEEQTLKKASVHIMKAGGKRIRPVFVLLSAQFGPSKTAEEVERVAVPLEMIHMASLVHDDVIDNADLRRGKATIKERWDNRTAMYTGDYLFARAIEIASSSSYPDVHEILSMAMREMCVGEIEQLRDQFQLDQNLRTYLRRIKRKTALLISVSCELGALVSGGDERTRRALRRYGYFAGMAFQVTDDILDFVGSEKQLGKPAGSDLIQGNITYPALYAMEHNPEFYDSVKHYMLKPEVYPLPISQAVEAVKQSGAVEASKKLAASYVKKAHEALDELDQNEASASLREIASYIGNRQF